MSDDYKTRLADLEQLDEDLFAFPDINGMADLLSASRGEAASGDTVQAPLPAAALKAAPAASPAAAAAAPEAKPGTKPGTKPGAKDAAAEPKAPLPAPSAAPKAQPSAPSAAPKAPPSAATAAAKGAPKNEGDLDEDLFGFGELIDLGAAQVPAADAQADDELEVVATEQRATGKQAPAATPTASASPTTSPTAAAPAAKAAPAAAPETSNTANAAAAPQPVAKPDAPLERKPKTKKDNKPTVIVREKPREGDAAAAPKAAAEPEHAAAHSGAGSPFLQFPTSIDLPPAKSKLLWVLVGCFLLANGGIFLMTQQQNENVNRTLIAVTSTLADAVARGSQAAPQRSEAPAPREREPERDPEFGPEARPEVPMLDASDYTNTHEFGVEAARKLIQLGEYAEARRTLFMVLANQDRGTPMAPSLREDIDYLIALTYYDQGRSIAPEVNE